MDVWQCDTLGVYSDVTDPSLRTVGKTFLRGYQVSDASGTATFTICCPSWYQGRTVHIHFKICTQAGSRSAYKSTSQLFFDNTSTNQAHAQVPYARKGRRTVRNADDGIYQTGGSQLLLNLTRESAGYAATFPIGLQIS